MQTLEQASDRFWGRVEFTNTCWFWRGTPQRDGYGQFKALGKNYMAHRFSYFLSGFEVPTGLEIDHTCRNRNCVNPDHLEPVTRAENMRRSVAKYAKVTHCKNGHPFSGDNLVTRTGGKWRYCRTCRNARQRAYLDRKRLLKES
jgi:hypothetical protein